MKYRTAESAENRSSSRTRFESGSDRAVPSLNRSRLVYCSSEQNSNRGGDPAGEVGRLGDFRSFLCRQARGITGQFGGRVESSDLVQQTLLEAYRQLDRFQGETDGELAKWLSQMLSNNIIDAARALRRKKRDIARERPLGHREDGSMAGDAHWLAAEQTSPSNCVQNAEQLLAMSKAISELPEPQQEVVVLHHLQGHSLAEVAIAVNRTPAAVAGLLYRGLKSLRSKLSVS